MDGMITGPGGSLPDKEPKPIEKAGTPDLKTEHVAPATLTKTAPKRSLKHRFMSLPYIEHIHLKKWQWAIVGSAAAILIVLGGIGGYYLYKHITKTTPLAQIKATPKPKTEPSRLTGLPVKPELNLRPVTGVMIENSPDARPQSGLLDAGLVVEAIAEGGITRFLALYEDAQPSYIGPVRSVRPYYLDFAMAFNASIAHVGGSPEALGQVRGLKVRDLDEFANAGAYQRITQRYAPHNVYTSTAKLDKLNKAKGYTSSIFTSFPRKKDQPSKKPTATSINMDISGFYYNTHYDYDTKTNSYKRKEGGVAHTDERSKKQLSPKVVISLVMSYSIQSDGKHSKYATTGTGTAYIFQDGIVTKATWHKASRSAQITFTDAGKKTVRLNAGQTWLTLVGSSQDVTYRP